MSYVYIQTERNPALYTVGFYKPDGSFEPDSDHAEKKEAAERVSWLNGGITWELNHQLTEAAVWFLERFGHE